MASVGLRIKLVVHLECSEGFTRAKVADDGEVYDANGDGVISRDELAAAEANFERRLSAYRDTIVRRRPPTTSIRQRPTTSLPPPHVTQLT